MTLKTYQQIRLVLTVIIAIVFSQFYFNHNLVWPLITLTSGWSILMILRSRVKEVIADERDYAIAGKAASWAIQIYSWVAVVSMFVLNAFQDSHPDFKPIALTLAFSACGLMLTYSTLFKFISREH